MNDPWRANLLRVLAIENAKTPEERAAAEAMPVYPLPQNDLVWALHKHNRDLMEENVRHARQLDALKAQNDAMRHEFAALRQEIASLRRENRALQARLGF